MGLTLYKKMIRSQNIILTITFASFVAVWISISWCWISLFFTDFLALLVLAALAIRHDLKVRLPILLLGVC